MISRKQFNNIRTSLFLGEALILIGPRQVGKTTLLDTLLEDVPTKEISRFNGDFLRDQSDLQFTSLREMEVIIGDTRYIIIDEAQKIPNIGNIVKSMVDIYKHTKQVIITGSSTLGLLDQTSEPLTGRKKVYHLFPIAFSEMTDTWGLRDARSRLEELLIYGSYPQVLLLTSPSAKKHKLQDIVSGQLYRDILEFQTIKNPDILTKLLSLLAVQIGQEVAYNMLANQLGVSQQTIERYVDLLEKSFVIFRVTPFVTNKIKEVTKMKKIYFYDLGIRNALLQSWQPLELRTDLGALWENFFILERRKFLAYSQPFTKQHFWRTKLQEEIDLLEQGESIQGFECKWQEQRYSIPAAFRSAYPDIPVKLVHHTNFWEWL